MDARARDIVEPYQRRRFFNTDIVRMIEIGVLGEDEFFELLRGDIIVTPSERDPHAYGRSSLLRAFIRQISDEFIVATAASLFLFDDTEVKPDLHVLPLALRSDEATGADVLLAVEIAVNSHVRDFEVKKPLYATAGVRELWILDLDARRAHVFREPDGTDYRLHRQFGADEPLSPVEFPQVTIRLRDLLR